MTTEYKTLLSILHNQVVPALGCTEPGAVAYAVSRARELLGKQPDRLKVTLDKNVLKNCMDVGIPGTKERGVLFAAALALAAGKSQFGLEALKGVTDADIAKAIELQNSHIITLELDRGANGLSITADVGCGDDSARVMIQKLHTNIVFESVNGRIITDRTSESAPTPTQAAPVAKNVQALIRQFSIDALIDAADTLPFDEIEFIRDGIEMNLRIAQVGAGESVGIGIGRHFARKTDTPAAKAKACTAAASEARMAGLPLSVMSSAGSGNHGLVAIIPTAVFGREIGADEEKIIRAVTLSHLITIFAKAYLGVLAPICGCAVAAGLGAAAGLTYLRGGSHPQIHAAINNMIAGISGMICDGAKLGCSYKLSIAVDAAVDASDMALENLDIPSDNGILGATAEKSIQNLAQVSVLGMNNTDSVILDVMMDKCR